MRLAIFFGLMSALLGGCGYINQKMGWSDDHILEELAEQQIAEHTGLDIDLSPGSEEKIPCDLSHRG